MTMTKMIHTEGYMRAVGLMLHEGRLMTEGKLKMFVHLVRNKYLRIAEHCQICVLLIFFQKKKKFHKRKIKVVARRAVGQQYISLTQVVPGPV